MNGTDEQIDRYWKLARKAHTSGLGAAERAELRKLSRRIGGAYH